MEDYKHIKAACYQIRCSYWLKKMKMRKTNTMMTSTCLTKISRSKIRQLTIRLVLWVVVLKVARTDMVSRKDTRMMTDRKQKIIKHFLIITNLNCIY